jgi:cytochrome c551/c552
VDGQSRFPKLRGESAAPAAAAAAAPTAAPAVAAAGKSGQELVQQWTCNACHKFDGPDRLVGPSLWDVGARHDVAYIRESILQPDAQVVEGYPPQVMHNTLEGLGFYQKTALQDLNTLVDYLTSLKGGQ